MTGKSSSARASSLARSVPPPEVGEAIDQALSAFNLAVRLRDSRLTQHHLADHRFKAGRTSQVSLSQSANHSPAASRRPGCPRASRFCLALPAELAPRQRLGLERRRVPWFDAFPGLSSFRYARCSVHGSTGRSELARPSIEPAIVETGCFRDLTSASGYAPRRRCPPITEPSRRPQMTWAWTSRCSSCTVTSPVRARTST